MSEKKSIAAAKTMLIGRTIVDVIYMTKADVEASGQRRAPYLVLDNGTTVLPFSDDECNDTGVLDIVSKDGANGVFLGSL